jgi:hypothetical protein
MSRSVLYGKRTVRAAAYNRMAAKFFLDRAEKEEGDILYLSQASLIFSAFTHEAFLNTLGERLIKEWACFEYDKPQEKLTRICSALQYQPAKGKRPYQTLKRLFWFRNLTAHGRDSEHNVREQIPASGKLTDAVKSIESPWEQYCTKANARRAYEDVQTIAVDLCEKAGFKRFPGFPFGTPVSGMYVARASGESSSV